MSVFKSGGCGQVYTHQSLATHQSILNFMCGGLVWKSKVNPSRISNGLLCFEVPYH